MRRLAALFFLVVAASTPVIAQTDASFAHQDSLFKRARRMVVDGNGLAGRALVDSLLKQAEDGTSAYGDALYWHGALAETAAEAERDYRRVIVEYPLSHYADDALLAIVELEQARGDRAGALAHLQRFVREHASGPARGTAALAAARLAFEQRDTRTGCSLISDARASVTATDVELRNQIDYYGTRCATLAMEPAPVTPAPTPLPARDSAPGAVAPSKKNATTARPNTDTAKSPPAATKPSAKEKKAAAVVAPVTPPAPVAAPRGNFTIQLAAYATRADADRLVAKLAKSGVSARVSGASKPFRVRLDFYPTRQAAQDEVVALKAKGIVGFVTTETPAPAKRAP
ncbi:MAG: SPOR domain-containing protein [Gemmatimonadaceae bacterium]